MGLGTDQITITTADKFIPDVWSMEVLRATENALIMAPLVKRYDALVAANGDTIHIPNLTNLSANDKSANTQVTLQSVTETETTINIDKHKETSFLVEDIVKVQSMYDLMAEYTSKAGFAIAEKVDSDLLALYSGFSNTDVGSYGTDVTNPVILAAIEALDLANAPLEDRAFVFHPKQKTAIAQIDTFIRADYLGNYQSEKPAAVGPQSRFMWGELWGVPAYYTKQVPTTAGTPTQYHNILFHKEALALALQQKPRVQSAYVLEYLGTLVVVDIIYGLKNLRGAFGVEIRS
jgi:N4-gp56 family major capsid protein